MEKEVSSKIKYWPLYQWQYYTFIKILLNELPIVIKNLYNHYFLLHNRMLDTFQPRPLSSIFSLSLSPTSQRCLIHEYSLWYTSLPDLDSPFKWSCLIADNCNTNDCIRRSKVQIKTNFVIKSWIHYSTNIEDYLLMCGYVFHVHYTQV